VADVPDAQTDLGHDIRAVARKLLKGMVVPLLGAGVNACGRPPDFTWQLRDKQHLPTGRELATYLAKEFDAPEELAKTADLTRVSQFIDSVESSGGELYQALHDIFDADYHPGPVHVFLARIAPLLRERNQLQVILTTNYDDALERAFEQVGEPYELITYIASSPKEYRGRFMHWAPGEPPPPPRVIESANDYRLGPEKRAVILKLHGAVQRLRPPEEDNYVITEDNYIEYLTHTDITSQLPSVVTDKLRNSSYLFLGYGMRDWNLRAILRRVWGEQVMTYGSWAIQKEVDTMEQAFWEKRNVKIVKIDLEEYIELLGVALDERIAEQAGS
jgi:SIR2-like domain